MKAKWIRVYEDYISNMDNIGLIFEAINTVVQDEQHDKRDIVTHDIAIKELNRRINEKIIQ